MRKLLATTAVLAACFIAGCGTPMAQYGDEDMVYRGDGVYEQPPTLTASLFRSDQAVLEDAAIDRILASRIVLDDDAKVAVMRFPDPDGGARRYYGAYYWRSEDYLKTQQQYIDTVISKLEKSDRVKDAVLLPSLLTPSDATIPVLREAAVRLQANLLLVFRTTSDIYHRSRMFANDQVKAYCTTELVLLDVRTGVIPFTTVTTREAQVKKERQDADINETIRRAESQAVLDSLGVATDGLTAFLTAAQRPGNITSEIVQTSD